MPAPEFTRRPDFDQIVSGWGGDNLALLSARRELIEWWAMHHPLTQAEEKVARAMNERLKTLYASPQMP